MVVTLVQSKLIIISSQFSYEEFLFTTATEKKFDLMRILMEQILQDFNPNIPYNNN